MNLSSQLQLDQGCQKNGCLQQSVVHLDSSSSSFLEWGVHLCDLRQGISPLWTPAFSSMNSSNNNGGDVIKGLLSARHSSKCFIEIISCNFHNNSMRHTLISILQISIERIRPTEVVRMDVLKGTFNFKRLSLLVPLNCQHQKHSLMPRAC